VSFVDRMIFLGEGSSSSFAIDHEVYTRRPALVKVANGIEIAEPGSHPMGDRLA